MHLVILSHNYLAYCLSSSSGSLSTNSTSPNTSSMLKLASGINKSVDLLFKIFSVPDNVIANAVSIRGYFFKNGFFKMFKV